MSTLESAHMGESLEVDEGSSASGTQRRPTDDSRFATVRRAQLRAVGTAFLRARPVVVAPAALANGVLLWTSGAPAAQRVCLAVGLGTAVALFVLERFLLRSRQIGEAWLAASLAGTSVFLAIGCFVSGGLASPILPLLLAPAVVSAAAFGRGPLTQVSFALSLALVIALGTVASPFPLVPRPYALGMTGVSFAALLALAYAGVAGLVAAYARMGETLDRMRLAAIEEAAGRMRAAEQVGAKVAHELKNPMAAIKALLQLVRAGATDKPAQRLDVALSEVERMDAIVRDYLAFSRPIVDLELAPVRLRELGEHVLAVLESKAELAGVELAVVGPDRAIRGDARRLREALLNLVDNALAATPRGGRVTIGVDAGGLVVEDTGSGVAPGVGAAFVTTRPGGTGLGLTIARATAEQHGGSLRLEQRAGGGTRAVLALPDEPGGGT